MDGEIENLKKSIIKEQERNENLTMLVNKADADIKHVCHQIEQSNVKKDLLQKEYMTFTSMLHEAEQSLAKTTAVSLCACNHGIEQAVLFKGAKYCRIAL